MQIQTSDIVVVNGPAISPEPGTLVIAPDVLVAALHGDAIDATNNASEVQVYGTVIGEDNGVTLGTSPGLFNENLVRVLHDGSIHGEHSAIEFLGGGNIVINEGYISSYETTIRIDANSPASVSKIINRGVISGPVCIEGTNEALAITNYGTIENFYPAAGAGIAIVGSTVADVLKNHGTITGGISLGAGNDTYDGRKGTTDGIVYGGNGADRLYAGEGEDELRGETGDDTLMGGAGRDVLNGGIGTDRASYSSAASGVTANLSKPGINTGDAKGDTYIAIEELAGSEFSDKLTGNASNNRILGGEGDDVINGRAGKDKLAGGDGRDTFVFDTALNASTNVDSIVNFDPVDDAIQIDNAVFLGLSTGTLGGSAFRANGSGNAADASDRIIYETDTGKLFFDADGTGAGAKILFAALDPGLALSNTDFVVI